MLESMTEQAEEFPEEDANAKGYLLGAGIPAGLLLWLGSRWVLKKVGDNEAYQREASGTLGALEWLQGFGLALAVACILSFLWGFRKLFWRRKS
jgi:hypothetical protein